MMSLADRDIKRQTPRNLVSNGVAFVTTFVVGMWLVPYLRGHLGTAGYGLIPLAFAVISYVALLVQSLNRSISRFLTLDIQRQDNDAALQTFNTSIRLLLCISLVHIPVLALFAWLAVRYLNIPTELVTDAFHLFLLVFASFFVSVFSAVYRTSLDALNRLDFKRIIETARLLVRAALIVVLFAWRGPNLTRVGLAGLIASVVELLLSMALCRHVTPQLVFRRGVYDKTRGREMLGMGKWIILQNAGLMLLMKVDLIIVNLKGGAEMTGDYAPCLLMADMVRNIAIVMAGVIWPVIMLSYARSQWSRLARILRLSVRALGAAVAIPVGVACGLAAPFLSLWIGKEYAAYAPLLILLIFHLPINLSVVPLYTVHSAYNRVRAPAIVVCLIAVLHVLLALVLASGRLGVMYGVAVAGVITWTLKDLVFVPLYTTHIMKDPWYAYFGSLLRVTMFLAILGGSAYITQVWLPVTSWLRLFLVSAALGTVALPAVWFFQLGPNERRLCMEMIFAQGSNVAAGSDSPVDENPGL